MTRYMEELMRLDQLLYKAQVAAPSPALTAARTAVREAYERVSREYSNLTWKEKESDDGCLV